MPALVQLLSDVIQDLDAFHPLVVLFSVRWYSPSCFSLVVLKWLLHSLQKASGQYSRQKEVESLHQQSLVKRVKVSRISSCSGIPFRFYGSELVTSIRETQKLRNRVIIRGSDQL